MFDLVDSLFSFYKTKMLMFGNISHDMSCSEWMCSNRELVQCFRTVIQFAYHYWNSLWITALQCHIASLIDCNLSPVFAYFTIWNYIVGHIVMLTRMNLVVLVYYILINIICSSICRNCLLHKTSIGRFTHVPSFSAEYNSANLDVFFPISSQQLSFDSKTHS